MELPGLKTFSVAVIFFRYSTSLTKYTENKVTNEVLSTNSIIPVCACLDHCSVSEGINASCSAIACTIILVTEDKRQALLTNNPQPNCPYPSLPLSTTISWFLLPCFACEPLNIITTRERERERERDREREREREGGREREKERERERFLSFTHVNVLFT